MINLALVIVTFNRIEKLKKTLLHYDQQTADFSSLIVVNNASNDGTDQYLSEWSNIKSSYKKYVINLPENMGGSGGFYEGQKFALTLNPDWIYVADDDAYADRDMIAEFYRFIEERNTDNISAVCATVYNADGSIAYEHRRYLRYKNYIKQMMIPSYATDYEKAYFNIDLLSYVGSFLKVSALLKIGLVNPRYFIYEDDSEHSLRLKKNGDILCVPKMKIIHDSGQNIAIADEDVVVSWRDYYAIRNLLNKMVCHNIFTAIYITGAYVKKMLIRGKNMHKDERRMICQALVDAWCDKLGKHKIYSPGWQINK